MEGYNYPPYYDRYAGETEHKSKGYTKILAKPGLAEQASEFNEIQSIQRDYLERLGNALYKDGSIISGCTLNISGTTVTISAGRIFLDGLIRDVPETTLSITGVGIERIIASLTTTIVTASQDSSLRDPAQGAENYGLEGADREKQVVTLTVIQGDPTGVGAEIYMLEEGAQPKVITDENTNSFITTDILAERTFDENGSYKVEGILIRDMAEVDGDKIKVYISNGKAYVCGYSVLREAMTSVLLDQSTDTRSVQSESHYYNSSYDTYELSNGPVIGIKNGFSIPTCLLF